LEPGSSKHAATNKQKAASNAKERIKERRIDAHGFSIWRDCFALPAAGFAGRTDWRLSLLDESESGNSGRGWECLKASFNGRLRAVLFMLQIL
jgi:hypothetical protein